MQHSSSIIPMIIFSELPLSGLTHASVTNNWTVYQIKCTVVVKKGEPYQHPTMWMGR